MTKKLDKAYGLHANERKRLADKNREKVNSSRNEKVFFIGQCVTLKNHAIAEGGGGSLKNRNIAFYEIISINKKKRSCILKHLANGSKRGARLMNIKPMGLRNNEDPVPIRNETLNLIQSKDQRVKKDMVPEKRCYNLRSNQKI